jgi:hypothetical protein
MTDAKDTPATLRPMAARLRPLLATMVPAASALSAAELDRVLDRVDARLALEDPGLRRQLRLFVRVLWWLPLLTTLRTLGGLSPEGRAAFLLRLQDGPVTKFRVGLWGLRTLLYLGWYGDPAVQARLGYRPDARGWEALERGPGDEGPP